MFFSGTKVRIPPSYRFSLFCEACLKYFILPSSSSWQLQTTCRSLPYSHSGDLTEEDNQIIILLCAVKFQSAHVAVSCSVVGVSSIL
jgi:hypothetical protein